MASFMAPLSDYTYAALRIVTGLLFMFHGSQKLLGWPVPPMDGMPPFITYIAGPIELIGGALVMVGLMTPLGGVRVEWSDGRCILDGAWYARVVSDAQRRRTRNRVLLCLPVHLIARPRHVESRCDAGHAIGSPRGSRSELSVDARRWRPAVPERRHWNWCSA